MDDHTAGMSNEAGPPATRRTWLRGVAGGLAAGLVGHGCRPLGGGPVAATDWPEAALAGLDPAWRQVRPTPGSDLLGLVVGGLRADAVVGGSLSAYGRIAGRVEGAPVVAARPGLGIAFAERRAESGPSEVSSATPRSLAELGSPIWAGRVALGDPRDDPATRAVLLARLEAGPWDVAFAELVRVAGYARPIGRGPGSALASLIRGEADAAPTASNRRAGLAGVGFHADPGLGDWVEGAAVLAGSRRADAARRLVERLAERAGSPVGPRRAANPAGEALRVELLGSTLVEAQPELVAAAAALRRSDRAEAERAAVWMVQPPPWPPASIEVLKRRPGGDELIASLAAELAPEPEPLAWLLDSWGRDPAPIDGRLLDELAGAAGGRLAREPRFRAWLQVEWRAWARQRYRRTARVAAGQVEAPPA